MYEGWGRDVTGEVWFNWRVCFMYEGWGRDVTGEVWFNWRVCFIWGMGKGCNRGGMV